MQLMTEVLENELKNAVEVKDENALHRYVSMMVEQKNKDEKHDREHELFREAVQNMNAKTEAIIARTDAIVVEMRGGFASVDKRFSMMTTLVSICFIVIGTMITLFQIFG